MSTQKGQRRQGGEFDNFYQSTQCCPAVTPLIPSTKKRKCYVVSGNEALQRATKREGAMHKMTGYVINDNKVIATTIPTMLISS